MGDQPLHENFTIREYFQKPEIFSYYVDHLCTCVIFCSVWRKQQLNFTQCLVMWGYYVSHCFPEALATCHVLAPMLIDETCCCYVQFCLVLAYLTNRWHYTADKLFQYIFSYVQYSLKASKALSTSRRRLGLPYTLIRHGNGSYRKRSSNRRNCKAPALRFCVNKNPLLKKSFFRRRWRNDNHANSSLDFYSDTNLK